MNELSKLNVEEGGDPQPFPPTILENMPIADYRRAPGVSKSGLDWIHKAPALLEWSRNAPIDTEAAAAVTIGTAFHSYLLEPSKFDAEYVADFKAPDGAITTVDDLKQALIKREISFKLSGSKGELTRLLLENDPNAPVSEVMYGEWTKGAKGRMVLSGPDMRKLQLMRDSVMAHPDARALLEMEHHVERSHFWVDEETGELCRIRPDIAVSDRHWLADVKTAAKTDAHSFARAAHEYRYYVQDPFYSEGYTRTVAPCERFLFIVVSTSLDRARYPVHVRELPQEQRDIGQEEWREDLRTYAHCRKTGEWNGVEELSLPEWFLRQFEGEIV